jgi:tRNA dimethylallyltransferase
VPRSDVPRRPIVILGPTAAGKSEIALQVSRLLEAEIVGADSRQIYRGLEIGTSRAERARPSHRDASPRVLSRSG